MAQRQGIAPPRVTRRTPSLSLRSVAQTTSIVAAAGLLVWTIAAPRANPANWLVVAQDSNYTIAIDTSRIARESGDTYDIWYRTDHAAVHYYEAHAFNRETVHTLLRCPTFAFRVVSTAMSMGSSRPTVTQVDEQRDVQRQGWHRVEPGSIEADAARASCIVAMARFAR